MYWRLLDKGYIGVAPVYVVLVTMATWQSYELTS